LSSETARIEAFSDGVFAIAITLLILEIKVPSPGPVPLATALARQWPSYVSFVISFAFIGIMWINHHRLFNHIKRADNLLMLFNLFLLFGVTVIPFPTAVLAAHLGHPDERTAAILFNGAYVVIAIFFNVLWRYAATRGRLLGRDANMAEVDRITRQYAFGPLMYLVCLGLVWISVPVSLAANGLLACFFALPAEVGKPRSAGHSSST
jgi:uncharacterized membrane protein